MEPIMLIILVIVGFLLGIFGAIIGSTQLILVPLFYFLGLPMHTALGSAKTSQIGREIFSMIIFHKKKLINFKLSIPLLIAGAIASFFGVSLIISLSEKVLSVIVGIFMIVISLLVFLKPDIGLKEKKIKSSNKTFILSIIAGVLIGFYQGIFGGGTNVFLIFTFVLVFGNDFLKAVANAKLPNLAFILVSSTVFIINGYINWAYTIAVFVGTSFGAYFGAKLAIKKGNKFIKWLFVGLVIVMAIKLLFFS